MTRPDFLIIGSGPSGVSVAYPLVEAGRKVLMIDAGTESAPSPVIDRPNLADMRQSQGQNWRHMLGSDLRYPHNLSSDMPRSPKLRMESDSLFLQKYVLNNRLIVEDFTAIGILAQGGLSNFWGAVVPAYQFEEFGCDQLDWKEMLLSFHRIASRIGVSGSDIDSLADYMGTDFPLQPPLSLSPIAQNLLDRYQNKKGLQIRIGRNRSAVLSEPLGERNACDLNGGCMLGCLTGAIYNSKFDLEALKKFQNFEIRNGILIDAIRSVGGFLEASGRHMDSGEPINIQAAKVISAAGTLASTRLVMESMGIHDEEIPIQTTPAFAMALTMPSHIGKALPEESFGMAQLAFTAPIKAKISSEPGLGLLFEAESMAGPELTTHMPFSRPGARKLLQGLLPSLLIGFVYLPGSFSRNSAILERNSSKNLSFLKIKGGVSPDYFNAIGDLRRTIRNNFAKLGAYLLPGSIQPYQPGEEAHYAASLPMGEKTDLLGEVIDFKGLHVVDGAILPRLSAKHHTFTMMANADRIGRQLVSKR